MEFIVIVINSVFLISYKLGFAEEKDSGHIIPVSLQRKSKDKSAH